MYFESVLVRTLVSVHLDSDFLAASFRQSTLGSELLRKRLNSSLSHIQGNHIQSRQSACL
jgi:hypothetical protein